MTRDAIVVAVLGPVDRSRLERMIASGEASAPVTPEPGHQTQTGPGTLCE